MWPRSCTSNIGGRCSSNASRRWSGSPPTPPTSRKPPRGPSPASPRTFPSPRTDRALFQDIRRYFPITAQAQVAWAVQEGVAAAVAFIEEQIEAGALDGGVARCRATTRKGKPCQRTPLPERDYCPSHQHLERSKVAA